MNVSRSGLAGAVATMLLLVVSPAARADPYPPETGLGDHVTYYSVRSASGTMKQSWTRTTPDRPCEPLTCDCEGACENAPSVCTARPEICVSYGSQVYRFRLTLARRRDARAYLVRRGRSHKLVGAILLPVDPTGYTEIHDSGPYPCMSTFADQPNQPNYIGLDKVGTKIRLRERTTIFPQISSCGVNLPDHHDMVKAGFVPTFLVARSTFKRKRITLKLKADQPFSLGTDSGTISSHITIRLKKLSSGVQKHSTHVPS